MNTRNPLLNKLKYRISSALRPDRISISNETNDLELAEKISLDPKVGAHLQNMQAGLVKDGDSSPYYTKFERFLRSNDISYDYLDIHSSSWMEDAKKFDLLIWRPMSTPWELEEAREKIYFLERHLNKLVYPSYNEVVFYENKILQYYILKEMSFPVIETFISSDYDEVLNWIEKAEYPLVSKIKTGSASMGVLLLKDKNSANKYVEKIFRSGNPTYWPFQRQKNYVFFQKYIKNRGFDLRIVVIDKDNIFGYFREVPKGDFRASGMETVVKKELPIEAVKMAFDILNKLNFTNLSVDFLQSEQDNKFYIIEASNFVRVKTDEQLKINGIAGRYRYIAESESLNFEKGRYWVQELTLKKFIENNLISRLSESFQK